MAATFKITGKTSTTVTIYVSGVTTETRWQVICRLASDEDDRTGQAILSHTSDFEHTFTNLTPGTSYFVNVGPWNASTAAYMWIGRVEVTTNSSTTEAWAWWNPIGSGLPVLLEANEWNDFCTFINGVRDDNGLSAYSFTTVYRGDPIKAAYVNQAISAISAISGHGSLPAAVSIGDAITAQFFIDLADAINAAL